MFIPLIIFKIVAYVCVTIVFMVGMYYLPTTKFRAIIATIAGLGYAVYIAVEVLALTGSNTLGILIAALLSMTTGRAAKAIFS